MSLTLEQKQQIAAHLEGSSGYHLRSMATEYGVEIDDITDAARECEVIECQICNWWHGIEEMQEGDVCIECYEDGNRA